MSFSTDSIKRNSDLSQGALSKTSDALSSGKKKLNPADLEVVGIATNEAALYTKASQNIDYGDSVSNIQDSAYSSASAVVGRLGELATQAANGTTSDAGRAAISQESGQLQQELVRQSQSTSFNGIDVLNNQITIQAGPDSTENSRVSISSGSLSNIIDSVVNTTVATQSDAVATLDTLSSSLSALSQNQATIGANQSRLSYAKSSDDSASLENTKAASRIESADVADEVADRASANILSQANLALDAQVNKQSTSIARALLG